MNDKYPVIEVEYLGQTIRVSLQTCECCGDKILGIDRVDLEEDVDPESPISIDPDMLIDIVSKLRALDLIGEPGLN
jgi:hypothetical protein